MPLSKQLGLSSSWEYPAAVTAIPSPSCMLAGTTVSDAGHLLEWLGWSSLRHWREPSIKEWGGGGGGEGGGPGNKIKAEGTDISNPGKPLSRREDNCWGTKTRQ